MEHTRRYFEDFYCITVLLYSYQTNVALVSIWTSFKNMKIYIFLIIPNQYCIRNFSHCHVTGENRKEAQHQLFDYAVNIKEARSLNLTIRVTSLKDVKM